MAATRFGAAAVPVSLMPLVTSGLHPPRWRSPTPTTGSGRLFITLQDGRVMVHDGCNLKITPFLDIRSLVLSGGERGLLSIAFHPAFPATPYFYVYYTRQDRRRDRDRALPRVHRKRERGRPRLRRRS